MKARWIIKLISAALAYFGLGAAGWNGMEPTNVGIGPEFSPELVKYIATALAFFLPEGLKQFAPGFVKWLESIWNKATTAADSPEEGETAIAVRKVDPFQEDMDAFKLLAGRHSNENARRILAELLTELTNFHVYGKGAELGKLEQK